eukprot:m.404759 g.404759  ORF g.404759 m.404759 type:complete len:361 (+) comp20128_c2_seq4:1109-2191(+)
MQNGSDSALFGLEPPGYFDALLQLPMPCLEFPALPPLADQVEQLQQQVRRLQQENDELRQPTFDQQAFTKICAHLRRYKQEFLRAKQKNSPVPKRYLSLEGTPTGFGNCVICDHAIDQQLHELFKCGHVICGSTGQNRGGCAKTRAARDHKKTCTGGAVFGNERKIKLHGTHLREGSTYHHVNLDAWTPENKATVASHFQGAIKAFLAFHNARTAVEVEVRSGCIELGAQFHGNMYDVTVFQEFFGEKNVESLFPSSEFNLEADVCPGFSSDESSQWSDDEPRNSPAEPTKMDLGDEPTVRTFCQAPDTFRAVNDFGSGGNDEVPGGEAHFGLVRVNVSQIAPDDGCGPMEVTVEQDPRS